MFVGTLHLRIHAFIKRVNGLSFFPRSSKSIYGQSVGLTEALPTKPPCQVFISPEFIASLLWGESAVLLIRRADFRGAGRNGLLLFLRRHCF